MIQTVLKRDGRVVGFNEEKIVAAVRRAMLHTDKGEDMQLAHEIADRIACRGQEQMITLSPGRPESVLCILSKEACFRVSTVKAKRL